MSELLHNFPKPTAMSSNCLFFWIKRCLKSGTGHFRSATNSYFPCCLNCWLLRFFGVSWSSWWSLEIACFATRTKRIQRLSVYKVTLSHCWSWRTIYLEEPIFLLLHHLFLSVTLSVSVTQTWPTSKYILENKCQRLQPISEVNYALIRSDRSVW